MQYFSICVVLFCGYTISSISTYTILKHSKGIIPEFESHVISKLRLAVSGGRKSNAAVSAVMESEQNKCHPLTIPMCRRVGYNATSVKTNIYSNGLKGSDIETYLSYFENEICFEDLLFFVCTLFNPICFKNHNKPVFPCKSACLRVKKECRSTLQRFHSHWPLQLNCYHLPDYQTSVCITKDSIVSKTSKDFDLYYSVFVLIANPQYLA